MKGSLPTIALVLACTLSTAGAADGLFGDVAQESGIWSLEDYGPRDQFDEQFRDLDVFALNYARAWRMSSGFEFSLSGGPWLARGTRWEPLTSDPPVDSDAFGISVGGGVRYNFPEVLRVRPFVDGTVHFSWAERPFPVGGSAVNGFVRWGLGLEVKMHADDSLDLGYRRGHVSNGGKSSVQNPAWNGDGLFLAWRRKLE